MLLQSLWDLCLKKVFTAPSTDALFNHYRDVDPEVDLPGAERIRRANLKAYLSAYARRPAALVLGEAPGLWGARFSGVPFTNERQLANQEVPFAGRVSGLEEPLVKTPGRSPYSSASTTLFWKAMKAYFPEFLGWYLVPITPVTPGKSFGKRAPTEVEMAAFSDVSKRVVAILKPKVIIAVGDRTAAGVSQLGVEFTTVHHPAHDARGEFAAGMKRLLSRL